MVTAAKEVPWEEVVDLTDELRDWLVQAGLAKKGQDPQHAAWALLSTVGDDESLPRCVAHSIVRLEIFRGAGRREDFRAGEGSAAKADEATRRAAFDEAIERKAEEDIRALFSRLAQIRKLVNQIAERKNQTLALVADKLVDPKSRERSNQILHHTVLARLNVVADMTRELYDDFLEFSPADTEEQITLAGWRRLEKSIRDELQGAGYTPPK